MAAEPSAPWGHDVVLADGSTAPFAMSQSKTSPRSPRCMIGCRPKRYGCATSALTRTSQKWSLTAWWARLSPTISSWSLSEVAS